MESLSIWVALFGGVAMHFQVVYDFDGNPGEDGYFVSPESTFAFMVDGCSERHSKKNPVFIYPGGLTGGQMIVRVVRNAFSNAWQDDSLDGLLLAGNEDTWNFQKKYRQGEVFLNDAGTLANASFSALKLNKETGGFRCIWGADVFTLWKAKSGAVNIVGGDNRLADMEREKAYASLVDAAQGDPEKVAQAKETYWMQTLPELKKKHDNVMHACLNGQPGIEKKWHDFSIQEPVDIVILLSDGAWIPMEKWDENPAYAVEFIGRLETYGLVEALEYVRELQKEGIASKRVTRPEATALAIFAD